MFTPLLATGFPPLCVPLKLGEGLIIKPDVVELLLWGITIVYALAIRQGKTGADAGPFCFSVSS